MNRHYKTLELDKILERLSGMTSIEDAREMALNLEPVFELKKVEQLLQQTDDAVALSGRFGAPSFGGAGCILCLSRCKTLYIDLWPVTSTICSS